MSEKRPSRRELTRRNRKKSDRRRNFRVLIVLALTLVFLYITGLYGASLAYFGDFISEGMMLLQLGGGYPIEGDFSRTVQAEPMGTGLCVLDRDKFSVYSPTGKEVFSYSHSMQDPVITTSGNRALIYDLNETSLKVVNGHSVLFQQDMPGNIIHASISSSNRVAVTTRSAGYNGEVTVYNYNMNQRFVWYCATAFPVYSSFSPGGRSLAVTCVKTDGGLLKSEVYVLDASKGEEKFCIEDSDYPLTTSFLDNDRLLIAYTGKLVLWDVKKNEKKAEYDFEGDSLWCIDIKSPYVAVASGGYDVSGAGELAFLSDELVEKFRIDIEDGIKDISISQSRIFALGTENLYEYTYSSELVSTRPVGALSKTLADYSGTVLVTSTGIEKIQSSRSK